MVIIKILFSYGTLCHEKGSAISKCLVCNQPGTHWFFIDLLIAFPTAVVNDYYK